MRASRFCAIPADYPINNLFTIPLELPIAIIL
nr:MAG TPA: hypothetical protein [Caudoviricetes sp.]